MRLNLGCGLAADPDMVNVDICPLPGVDMVADLDQPWPWKDGCAGEIVASHLFEHLDQPVRFMGEAWRVLEDGGVLDIRVPYYKHVFAFTDPTHRRFCTELTFTYWVPGMPLHEAYGQGMGSPPAVFTLEELLLVGQEGEELRVVLKKTEEAAP